MMIIAKVVIYLSCVVIMFCFDRNKDIIGDIALGLLLIAIAYVCANEQEKQNEQRIKTMSVLWGGG